MESQDVARQVVDQLSKRNHKLVLVESCTCGRIAAWLGLVPGVSQFLCGSWVTYRSTSKQQWLGISSQLLEEHTSESAQCSLALAQAAWDRTSEATLVAAITGDLGPGVDDERDGKVYLAIGIRQPSGVQWQQYQSRLQSADRIQRQTEAAAWTLQRIRRTLETAGH